VPNWNAVLEEIRKVDPVPTGLSAFDVVRRKYLAKLHDKTGRNIIAYYSGFLEKPKVEGVDITDEDKNGFMLTIHKLDRTKGLDLILHTPGGDVAATESLVHYLREMFDNDIRAIVPQIAMSAGTMIACACREIVMGKHSNLGPVDPQFSGIPAIGVIMEIAKAFEEIKADQRAALVWNPILSRLPPSFVQQCNWAIERSKEFLGLALKDCMFRDAAEPARSEAVGKIVERLSDLTYNKTHNRHFHYQECRDMGLNIKMIEDDFDGEFQDLVLTVHHCFVHTLASTAALKIIENHLGRAVVKQQVQQQILLQMPQPANASLAADGPPH
jgi:hypothetical protein